jgi:putative proteasome-type protease
MTYCVGVKLHSGLVFLSDSRTNAGVDAVSTFRKMTVFERENDRMVVLMTAGNLAISQAVLHHINNNNEQSIWHANNMFEIAELIGQAIRKVYAKDGETFKEFGIDFNVSIMLGGQIHGEGLRLFMVYSAGNFIEASEENCIIR